LRKYLAGEFSYCFWFSAAKVGETDIARVARRLLRSQPAIAARGELSKLPSLADFQSGLLDEAGKMPSKLGRSLLFR